MVCADRGRHMLHTQVPQSVPFPFIFAKSDKNNRKSASKPGNTISSSALRLNLYVVVFVLFMFRKQCLLSKGRFEILP